MEESRHDARVARPGTHSFDPGLHGSDAIYDSIHERLRTRVKFLV